MKLGERTILHSDMNCFYASVEMMLDPSLAQYGITTIGGIANADPMMLKRLLRLLSMVRRGHMGLLFHLIVLRVVAIRVLRPRLLRASLIHPGLLPLRHPLRIREAVCLPMPQ